MSPTTDRLFCIIVLIYGMKTSYVGNSIDYETPLSQKYAIA